MKENQLPEEQIDWDDILSKFPIGTKVCGRVMAKPPYGVWVEIESPERLVFPRGLVAIIRVSDSPSVGDEMVKTLMTGDSICAIVIWLDVRSGIHLSTRRSDFEKYGFEEGW